jgi:DNA repair photolyase
VVTFRAFTVRLTTVKSALSETGLPDLKYALNPYIGCAHSCIYCYARLYTRDRAVSENWGGVVVVKYNLPQVLEREVKSRERGVVGVGTITDPYQPVEAYYEITAKSLRVLLRAGFPVSIQTKNPLVLRDLELLAKYRDLVDVGFTITTLSYEKAEFIEPRAPPPRSRVEALRELSARGIKTWIFYGPVIPGLNDDEETTRRLVMLAAETGSVLYYDPVHVKPFMRNPAHPLYVYVQRATREWRLRVEESVLKICRELGVTCKPGFTGDAPE